ncbi:hypothetical protein D3C77_479290 [compost metagenome]
MINVSIEREACLRRRRVTGMPPAIVLGDIARVVRSKSLSCAGSPSPNQWKLEPLIFFGRSRSPTRPGSIFMPRAAITVLLRRMSTNWSMRRSVATIAPPLAGSPLLMPRTSRSCGT